MSKKLIPAIVVAIVAIVIVLLVSKKDPVSTNTPVDTGSSENATTTVAKPAKPVKKPSAVVTPAPTTPTTPGQETDEPAEEETPTAKPVVVTERFYVSDTTATPKVLEVNKGDTVQVTFVADPRDNYHGGLEFRSVLAPVKILNGQSQMVSFTADESFSFTPYWPGSDVARAYTIDIIVK